ITRTAPSFGRSDSIWDRVDAAALANSSERHAATVTSPRLALSWAPVTIKTCPSMKLSLAEAIEATQSIVNVTRIFGMDRGIRRIPFITFKVLHACGVIVHQTYNQRFPQSDKALAAKARDKYLMGYHDVQFPSLHLLVFRLLSSPTRRQDALISCNDSHEI